MSNYFSSNLIFLRKSKGWNQKKLGDKLNVDSTSVGKWEKAQSYPLMDKVLRIREIFEVDLERLFFTDLNNEGIEPKKEFLDQMDVIGQQTFEIKFLEKALTEITNSIDGFIELLEDESNPKSKEILEEYKEKRKLIDDQLNSL